MGAHRTAYQSGPIVPASQAGLAGGLFNAGRRTGGALVVATFGTLVSGPFMTGMSVSMLISAVLLIASTAAVFAVFRRRASRLSPQGASRA